MKIINTVTNKTVANIMTNHSMTLDEAINLVGEIYNDEDHAEENVEINGKWYAYEELDIEA